MISAKKRTAARKSRRGRPRDPRKADLSLRDVQEVEYVEHPDFDSPEVEEDLWGEAAETVDVPRYDLLPEVADHQHPKTVRRTTLSAAQERLLFKRYNYAKYRLAKLLEKSERASLSRKEQREVALWRRRAERTREQLVHANLPLVPSMVRRARMPGVEFADMMSEGYMAVLRSVEKFDVSRGFKFSTYACRSILACFHRLGLKFQTYHKRFPVQFEAEMEKSDFPERRHEQQEDMVLSAVTKVLSQNLAELTDMEYRVVQERYPMLPRARRRTLAQVGKLVGLSNERVRQIEKASLSKIRAAVEDELVA